MGRGNLADGRKKSPPSTTLRLLISSQYGHLLQPPTFLNWLPPLDGSHLSMAPVKDEPENGRVGPPTSFIQVAKPYLFEQTIQECLKATGVSQAREDTIRLQGVQWIDNVRKALKLWEPPLSRAKEMLTWSDLFERSIQLSSAITSFD